MNKKVWEANNLVVYETKDENGKRCLKWTGLKEYANGGPERIFGKAWGNEDTLVLSPYWWGVEGETKAPIAEMLSKAFHHDKKETPEEFAVAIEKGVLHQLGFKLLIQAEKGKK